LSAPRDRDVHRRPVTGERNVTLETFLGDNRAEIIKRTRAKVASRSSPQTSAIELEQGVPMLLSQLSATLKGIAGGNEGNEARTQSLSKTPAISQSSAEHGLSLLKLGFTIDQVVHDYGDVCQAVTEFAQERGVTLSIVEFQTLNRGLDNAIAESRDPSRSQTAHHDRGRASRRSRPLELGAVMESVRKSIAEKRENTDVSLDAERASANDVADKAAARARRLADDLVERERLLVDERLRKFRDSADIVLARERRASTAPFGVVAPERTMADKATMGERENNDAIVEYERRRSDDAVKAQREEQVADPAEQARRADTDEKLGAERLRVDHAVTFLGNTEEALSLAKKEIDRRSNVLAMVAHELRNPLAVISMNVDFMAERLVDPEVREPAMEVQRSVARMTRLLQDLLDLARIEAGTIRILKQPFDVGALSSEILAAYEPVFATRGVGFTCEPRAPGIVVNFDHDRIVQVLSNLLSNAMKATPPGGAVSLCTRRRADDIEFAVEDTGAGIAAHALPHVFNRFWQGSSEPGTGLGLGLYICEKIVAAHAGRIWVESELGRGTTFRFTLPVLSTRTPLPVANRPDLAGR
jgi:signal transduction histidine kinase